MRFSRSFKEGAGSWFNIVLVLGICILIQYFISLHPKQWDLTKNKIFSLSGLSKKVLSSLHHRLNLWAFISPHDQSLEELIHEYRAASSEIRVHFVNPNSEPLTARKFGITSPPPVVAVKYQNNPPTLITQPDESRITNAINLLITGKKRVVYFLDEPGAPNPNSSGSTGYSQVIQAMTHENFVVRNLVLYKEKAIPKNASCVIEADPHYPFFSIEKKELLSYFHKGGRILFFIGFRTSPKNVNFLKSFGIEAGKNLVIDADPNVRLLGAGPGILVANHYGQSPITRPFEKTNTPSFLVLPLARNLLPSMSLPSAMKVSPLVSTSTFGQAFPLHFQGKKVQVTFKKPILSGKIPVAMTVQLPNLKNKKLPGRVVVIGSGSFADNQWIQDYANQDFVLNIVSWLSQSPNTLAIPPKNNQGQPLILDRVSAAQLLLLVFIILPGFGIAFGFSNWIRRRSL
jgi:ABC-type uncharacterized transport system involved in gliding motility auxiliary subunit